MLELAEGRYSQFQRRYLSRVEINSEYFTGPLAQHGQRIVARRGNGKARETWLNIQGFEKNICVFPTLGVTDAGKVGVQCRFATHGLPRFAACELSLCRHQSQRDRRREATR